MSLTCIIHGPCTVVMKADEIKHYLHGLAQIYLGRRVVWGITLAEDVLLNEVQ